MIHINAPSRPLAEDLTEIRLHGSGAMSPFDIAFLCGVVGAFVVFSATLAYVTWEYSRKK